MTDATDDADDEENSNEIEWVTHDDGSSRCISGPCPEQVEQEADDDE